MNLLPASLEAFLAIAKAGTVHGAARELRLTQSALTTRLKLLEQNLSTTLFLRTSKGMRLTDAGIELRRYCETIVDLEGTVLAKISGKNPSTHSRVSFWGPSSLLSGRVIPAFSQTIKAFKNVSLSFNIDDGNTGIETLRQGNADFAIVPYDDVPLGLESKRLKPEEYVLVGPAAWKKRAVEDIVSTELAVDFDVNDRMTINWLKKHHLNMDRIDQRHFADNTDALVTMVRAGLGYTVCSKEFLDSHNRPAGIEILDDRVLTHKMALVWYGREHMPAHIKALIKSLM